jgi:hypothetical protein
MDARVQSYIEGVDPAYRPLFDRVHRLIIAAHPDADVVLSYRLPTYTVGKRRLYVSGGALRPSAAAATVRIRGGGSGRV